LHWAYLKMESRSKKDISKMPRPSTRGTGLEVQSNKVGGHNLSIIEQVTVDTPQNQIQSKLSSIEESTAVQSQILCKKPPTPAA